MQHLQQSVEMSAARLIFGLKRFDHITPALIDMHWLLHPQHITYKLCLIMFKCLHGLASSYLDYCCVRTSSVPDLSALRSAFILALSSLVIGLTGD